MPLAAALIAVFPVVEYALLTALAAILTLLGLGTDISGTLNAIGIFQGSDKARAWKQLLTQLTAALTNSAVIDSLALQGWSAYDLQSAFNSLIWAQIQANLPPLTYPSFADTNQLNTWYTGWVTLYQQGLIDPRTMDGIDAHYNSERVRLVTPVTPGQPVTPTTPTGAWAGYPGVPASEFTAGWLPTQGRWMNQSEAEAAGLTWPPPSTTAPSPGAGAGAGAGEGTAELSQAQLTAILTAMGSLGSVMGAAISAGLKGLAAPIVNVGSPTNIIDMPDNYWTAPAGPDVKVSNQIDWLGLQNALEGSLPLLATGAITGLLAKAENLGHGIQTGTGKCSATTGGTMLANMLQTGMGILTIEALRSETGIGGLVTSAATQFFEHLTDPDQMRGHVTPDAAPAAAVARLKQAMLFGIQAHSFSMLAESKFLGKNLGLSQLAGFMADLAGFQRIAYSVMGTVEQATMVSPMRYLVNRNFRPNIPGTGEIGNLYVRRYIPEVAKSGDVGLRQALALHGLPEEWINVYAQSLFRELGLSEIVRVAQYMSPSTAPGVLPADYYERRLERAGYDPGDIDVMAKVARRSTCRYERSAMINAASLMARQGFIDSDRVRELTLEAWQFDDPVAARVRATELQSEYQTLSDTRAVTLMAMSRGMISRDEARDSLTKLGMDGRRVELEVLKATLGMIPGMRLTVSQPEEVLEEIGVEVA